ncbi:MAG TPA: SLBB domain-containing protein [Gemmatimonadaceae bacterium]|nr:SLBB domain-containing protein [Gemmatimonadaceae bacterium]
MLFRRTVLRIAGISACALLFPIGLSAQGSLPIPASQIPAALQNASPSQISQLQQAIQAQGMTPDQIHQALRANGLPENTLDPYLPGAKPDSNAVVTDAVYNAVSKLGILDSAAVDSLRGGGAARRLAMRRSDSLFIADTLARIMQNDSTAAALRLFLKSRGADRALADSGFAVFGQDAFTGPKTQYDPILNGPVDDSYQLQPGDQLVLTITGDVTDVQALGISREGTVSVRNVGEVAVANLTIGELRALLFQKLSKVYSGVKPGAAATTHFDIHVVNLGVNQVYVYGDVKAPGSYDISRMGTVMNALYVAGGTTPNGDMRAVQVFRGDKAIDTLDLYDYFLTGKSQNDIRLQAGDKVFVSARRGMVRVAGAVLRPMTYELKNGQTLADVLRMAGGLTPDANSRWIQIERVLPPAERAPFPGGDRTTIDIRQADVSSSTEMILADDIIHVLRIDPHVANRVTVSGDVWSSGAPVAFVPGMRLSQALQRAGGVKPDVYRDEVQIARLRPDSTRQLLKVRLTDSLGTPADDLPLQDGDLIQVFSQTDFRPRRWVEIDGMVRKPGQYPYLDGMTARDLAMLAGGLQDGALLTDAEVDRMPANRANGALAQVIHVPLDSGYLFERAANGRFGGPPGLPAPPLSPDVPLLAYDKVLINRQPDFSLPRIVAINGEVKYPGPYALASKDEHLLDLIKRAGGLTPNAYPDGIIFSRQTYGRIGIDLPRVLKDSTDIDNLLLVDGDVITIPVYSGIVSIRGAVNSPVAVPYVAGRDMDYYIRAAGGPSALSEVEHAYVTQPNGKVESRDYWLLHLRTITPIPRPGSAVTVPAKDPNAKHDWGSIVAATTSILGSLVAIAAIVKR